MKIGLSSYSLSPVLNSGSMDIFGAVDFAAAYHCKHIELVSGGTFQIGNDLTFAGKLAEYVRSAGMEISSYTIGANFLTADQGALRTEINRVKREVETGAALGVTRMRHDAGARPGKDSGTEQFEKDFPVLVDSCGEIADHARQYGITTSIENHGVFVQNSERIRRIVLAVGRDNFRTTVDVGNFLCVDEDPEIAVADNLPLASMIHLKDFYIKKNAPLGKTGFFETLHGRWLRASVTGDGDVDLPAVVQRIREAAYDGFISVEYEGREECLGACVRSLENVFALFGMEWE